MSVPGLESDELLRALWNEGDRAAGNRLCIRYVPMLRRFFASRLLGDCDDLVQQTLLIALQGQRKRSSDVAFRAYIFGVARVHLIEFFRKRKRDAQRNVPLGEHEAPTPTPWDLLLGSSAALDAAIASLPQEYRDVLIISCGMDLNAPEIARELSVPVATVYSRLRRARDRLQHLRE